MKKFLSFLFVLFIGFTLVACQGPTTDDRVQVTFWHAMGAANQAVIDEMIESFEAKYPNVHVTQANQGGYDELRDKVNNSIIAGTMPTIAQTYPDHVTSYLARKDAVVNLNKYVFDAELGFDAQGVDESLYVDSFYKESTSYDDEGSMYSLPFNKSTEITFYNKTIFSKYNWFVDLLGYEESTVYEYVDVLDEEGQPVVDDKGVVQQERVYKKDFVWHPTWQELEKIGKAFIETGEYKQAVDQKKKVAAFSYDSQSNLFITLTQQLAALDENDTYGEKGETAYTGFDANKVGQFNFLDENNPYAVEAVRYYKEQYDNGYFATSGTLGVSYSSDAFKAVQCVVTIGSSAGAGYNDPGEAFEVGVGTYPQVEGTKEEEYQVIQQGTNVTLFAQKDPEVEKYGWLFILHMINFENALLWATKTAYFPIRSDVFDSQQYKDYIDGKTYTDDGEVIYEPGLKGVAAEVGWTQRNWFYTNCAFNGTDVARDSVELLVQNVLLNKKDSVDNAIASAFATCKDELNKYIVK